ncbi:MAG TPA: polymer-forming cytoskeletal protein, partial [Pyrinomonadaceae bacterium]
MQYSIGLNDNLFTTKFPLWQSFGGVLLIFICHLTFFSQTQISVTPDDKTLIIEDAPEMEVFAFGKTVIVKKQAKGVLSFGGDVVVEGRVEGDVAAIGGSITQKENAFIGGDVIIFGGTYRPESKNPLRNESKETVMYAGYEEELRDLTQNPSQIFSPTFSLPFAAQRVLSMLFWFVISLGLTTLAPGAVSRAVARFQLSTLKIFATGFAAFILMTITIIVSLSFLPNYLSAIFGLMAFVLLMLAY